MAPGFTLLISFEVEHQARRQVGQEIRLWWVELINHERRTLDESRTVRDLISPGLLTYLVFPLGQAQWVGLLGPALGILGCSSDHSEVGESNALTPPSTSGGADCPHEVPIFA